MADVEEPQFTTLAQRIAALKQQGVEKGPLAPPTSGKRPPPPPPPSANSNRPALPSRPQTTNNPPISTYGSSASKQSNNEPIGVRGLALRPPPPVDRDQPRSNSPSRALVKHGGPPPLPSRKTTQPSPALPPRKASTSTQLTRRGSSESTRSFGSTISGLSLAQSSSRTSTSSVDTQRKLPPALGDAKLPPLPPNRRELAEKTKNAKIPLITTKSTPNIPLRQPPVIDRDVAPKMPPRPTGPPKMPTRPTNTNQLAIEEAPREPSVRRLPPPGARKSILSMGFNNKEEDKPAQPPRPQNSHSNPTRPLPAPRPIEVLELTESNFDSAIRGKFAFIDFYTPYCHYCKELDPIWKQLVGKFASASNELVIAKVDVQAYASFCDRYDIEMYPTLAFFDGRNDTPEKYPYMRELEPLTEWLEKKTHIQASDLGPQPNGVPPPINLATKPKPKSAASQVAKNQSRGAPPPSSESGCLLCRDFSGPDDVAAQYPLQSLPRHDVIGYLADVLCGPFSSPTDKARAIFTWLHQNIVYDTVAFFSKKIKNVSATDTINSGMAVCGGYAGLYAAIGLKAGLETVMVMGHGKGINYTALKAGERCPPPDPTGHAWNAVKIDGGEWKLLDACWGAGAVSNETYHKRFNASEFTMSNEDFGLKHFPQDEKYFMRADGSIPSWESYYLGPSQAEPCTVFTGAGDHGLSETSFTPGQKHISVHSKEIVRFQFSKICEHWDHEKNGKGKPYCMILKIWGKDGRKDDLVPFDSNDFWWWIDIKAEDLGAPGQTVTCYCVNSVNGEERGTRGMTKNQFLQKKGKCGMGFGGIAAWELV